MPPYRGHRIWTTVSVVAAVMAAVSSCAAGASGDVPGKVDVVASTDVWGSIAAEVGGSRVAVTSIINDPGQDPHSFEASSRTLLAVRDADLLVENGGGYDDFMAQLVSTSGNGAPVVNAVQSSGYHPPPDGELNEHVWYDVPTVQRVAHAIAVALIHLDPRHRSEYRHNDAVFDRQLARVASDEHQVRVRDGGTPVSITEPLPLYLLRGMGLRNLTPPDFSRAVEESGDVSPRLLAETLDLYSEHRVALLVYNAQTSGPFTAQVESAARSAGVPVVPVTETLPDGASYIGWMSRTVAAIAKALHR
jgi:zinc/manganese transport system substrate-binding protein